LDALRNREVCGELGCCRSIKLLVSGAPLQTLNQQLRSKEVGRKRFKEEGVGVKVEVRRTLLATNYELSIGPHKGGDRWELRKSQLDLIIGDA
jgi:hypothetical protein